MEEFDCSSVCEYCQAILIDEDRLVINPPKEIIPIEIRLVTPAPKFYEIPNHGHIPADYSRQDVYLDLPNMRLTANAGCALCTLFTRDLDYHGPLVQNSEEIVEFDRTSVTAEVSFSVIPTSSLERSADENYYLALQKSPDHRISSVKMSLKRQSDGKGIVVSTLELYPQLALSVPKLSEQNIKLLKQGLGECQQWHLACRGDEDGFIPTRLVDVGSHASFEDLRLVTLVPPSTEYLALSYCWGQSNPTNDATFQANLDAQLKTLDFRRLSATVKDAISVTRALGYRYIWIDRLCIVQDDKEDWNHEASSMDRVYSNAVFTIAAAAADGATDGFLTTEPRSIACIPLCSGNTAKSGGRAFVLNDSAVEFDQEIEKSTWNSRGWTIQERLLSRRILFFGKRCVFFGCRYQLYDFEKRWRRDAIGFPSRLLSRKIISHETYTLFDFLRDAWYKNIAEYSNRSLTYRKDKLKAIEGLALRIQGWVLNPNGTYIFGLWKENLVFGLLWSVSNAHVTITIETPISVSQTQETALIPSWPWASINKPVYWPFYLNDDISPGRCFKIDWLRSNSTSLAMVGHTLNVNLSEVPTDLTQYREDHFISFGPSPRKNLVYDVLQDTKHVGYCFLDGERNSNSGAYFILPIYCRRYWSKEKPDLKRIAGLLLHQFEEDPGHFRRTGVFWSGSVSLQSQVIEIVTAVRGALLDDSPTRPLLYLD